MLDGRGGRTRTYADLAVVGFGDRCNRRYATPLYLFLNLYIYIISYFFIKINKDKNGERNVTENYVPHIKLICPKDLTGQAPSSNHGLYHAHHL